MCMDLIWWRHANNQNKTNTGCPADFVVNKFFEYQIWIKHFKHKYKNDKNFLNIANWMGHRDSLFNIAVVSILVVANF